MTRGVSLRVFRTKRDEERVKYIDEIIADIKLYSSGCTLAEYEDYASRMKVYFCKILNWK